jgi:hypothetical protein
MITAQISGEILTYQVEATGSAIVDRVIVDRTSE